MEAIQIILTVVFGTLIGLFIGAILSPIAILLIDLGDRWFGNFFKL